MQDETEKTATRKREPFEKHGKYRYLHRKLDSQHAEVMAALKRLEIKMRVLTKTLQPMMEIEPAYIQSVVCQDEADLALLEHLRERGPQGTTPTEAALDPGLRRWNFKPYHITRRFQRMNKRLKEELGRPVAESYQRRWVITQFVLQAWNESAVEVQESL